MKRWLAVMLLAGAAGSLGQEQAPPQPQSQPSPREELSALARRIEAEAQRWANQQKIEQPVDSELQLMTYTEEHVKPLTSLLEADRPEPVTWYVANKLLTPLLRSDPAVVRRVLPSVKKLLVRARFRPLPEYSSQTVAALTQMPKAWPPEVNSEEVLKQLAQLYAVQEEKYAQEKMLERYNRQIGLLHRRYVALALRADRTEEDTAVLSLVTQREQQGDAFFADVLSEIAEAAGTMPQGRAKRFYDYLVRNGQPLGARLVEYRNLSQVQASRRGAPAFVSQQMAPGILMLQTANALTGPAGTNPVPVPVLPPKK